MQDASSQSLLQASSRLESLRGLASIQVAMFHSLLVIEASDASHTLIPQAIALCNGRAAVTLFFVLSGLVLGLSLRRSIAPPGYVCLGFVIRRFFRIYPAFFAATLVACILSHVYARHLPLVESTWANSFIASSFTLSSLIKNLLFIQFDLNPVTWTLRMEMLCSLFLPLCFYSSRLSPRLPWLILLGTMILSLLFPTVISLAVPQAFIIGYLIPSAYNWWLRFSTNASVATVLTVLSLVLLLLPRSWHLTLPLITFLEAIGAALLIGNVIYGHQLSVFSILDRHLIKVAGRISYSYYLYHPFCIVFAARTLLPFLFRITGHGCPITCAIVLWIASSCLAFPLAWFSYQWIERPFIAFSKRFYPHSPRGHAAE